MLTVSVGDLGTNLLTLILFLFCWYFTIKSMMSFICFFGVFFRHEGSKTSPQSAANRRVREEICKNDKT